MSTYWSIQLLTKYLRQRSDPDALSNRINNTLKACGNLAVLNASLAQQPTFQTRVDWAESTESHQVRVGAEFFQYLSCRYFPSNGYTIANGTIQPTDVPNGGFGKGPFCEETCNITVSSEQHLKRLYPFAPKEILASAQILFSVGEYDPTTGYGPLKLPARESEDCNTTSMITVTEGSHTKDSLSPAITTKPGVLHALNVELQHIKASLDVEYHGIRKKQPARSNQKVGHQHS